MESILAKRIEQDEFDVLCLSPFNCFPVFIVPVRNSDYVVMSLHHDAVFVEEENIGIYRGRVVKRPKYTKIMSKERSRLFVLAMCRKIKEKYGVDPCSVPPALYVVEPFDIQLP